MKKLIYPLLIKNNVSSFCVEYIQYEKKTQSMDNKQRRQESCLKINGFKLGIIKQFLFNR